MTRAEQSLPNGHMLYVAGPMTGRPNHNKAAFDLAAAELRAAGYVVISPPEMDLIDGVDLAAEHGDADWLLALERDLVVVAKVDGLALLPEWEQSRGARLEVAAARGMGKDTRDWRVWRDYGIKGYS